MSDLILVTGATGNVGAEVIRLLDRQNQPIRAGIASRRDRTFSSQVEIVAFDFTKPETFEPALQGVRKLFLVRPPAISQVKRLIFPAIDAAKQAGVEQIVFLSLLGAEVLSFTPHAKIEHYIRSMGMSYTFLRPSFFMQNLSTTHRLEIKDQHEIFVPAGQGKTSFIDVRDIAAIAALVLTKSGHENQAYSLTGSEALNYTEVAEIFTAVLGRSVIYRSPSIARFAWRLYKRGVSVELIAVMIGVYTTARFGRASTVTPEAKQLLQREPIAMRQFVENFRSCWI